MRQLVDDGLLGEASIRTEFSPKQRESLGLQGEGEVFVGHHLAVSIERIGAENGVEIFDHARGFAKRSPRALVQALGEEAAYGNPPRSLARIHIELGDVDRHQVAGDRLAGLPAERARVAVVYSL